MKTEEISEALNLELREKQLELGLPVKGTFVVQRNIEVPSSFKAIKQYSITLWFVKDRKKHRIVTNQFTGKILTGQEDRCLYQLNILFLRSIFTLLSNNTIIKVLEDSHGISFTE